MRNSFDHSFKIYIDPRISHADREQGMDLFSKEVDSVKEDIKGVEKLFVRLRESNEEVKEAVNAKTMKEMRARLNVDLDHLLKLAKQINKKFDGLVVANAAHRGLQGSGSGWEDDQARASMISDLVENLKQLIRSFQGLRLQIEADHRQIIESRYFAVAGEKATAEAIDNFIASQIAAQEHGRGAMADAVAEIQERRDTVWEIRKSLMGLHQIFLGIATPVEVPSGGNKGVGGPPSPVGSHPVAAKAGTGSLNDYEKETRKQAYIAIGLALVVILIIITTLLRSENNFDAEECTD